MSEIDFELFEPRFGSVKAPAGCGKTQLITTSLAGSTDTKPALVLTHTNAGRAALEQRLRHGGIAGHVARVATLDSWAIRLVQTFPMRSGLTERVLRVRGAATDYASIRVAALKILATGHAKDVIKATYSRVIVDEYQDCGLVQHSIVVALSAMLPAVVLGDPLQGIFKFAGPTVNWREHVRPNFPSLPNLKKPWRWINSQTPELGDWLLNELRPALLKQEPIDLTRLPRQIEWVQIPTARGEQAEARLSAGQTKFPSGSTLIIGEGVNKSGQWAAAARCRALMVEALDMKDFISFATSFEPGSDDCLETAVEFFGNLMTGLSPKSLVKRTRGHLEERTRTDATALEALTLNYLRHPSYSTAATMLEGLCRAPGIFVYRPDIARLCIKAMRRVNQDSSFAATATDERERFRHMPRAMPRRAVGSTLLLKGLESENAVILEPEKMNAPNLYVAMTRASKRIVICSTASRLEPHNVVTS